MRVFVTGATGFIGQHLCQSLVDRGDRVIAMVRNPSKASRLPKAIETFVADLSHFASETAVLPECDVVIHLAGVIAASRMDEYEATNFVAVQNLVSCLGRQSWTPKRVLFASSLAAAGPSSREAPWTESDELEPIDAYGAAKARAETAFRAAKWPSTIFRPPIGTLVRLSFPRQRAG